MAERRRRGRQGRPSDQPRLPFTTQGLRRGARLALPVGVSTVAFGLVFGVLARRVGLSAGEVCLMSALVFTGSGQAVAIGMWATPIPVVPIVATTLLIGLRHVLMGLTLQPWYARLPAPRAYACYFLLTDESWALTTVEFDRDRADGGVLVGAGAVLFALWVSSSTVGRVIGAAIRDPSAWGLEFALVAVFIALLASLARGRSTVLPWALAASVAVAAEWWLPGAWYVLLGALAGSIPGLVRHA